MVLGLERFGIISLFENTEEVKTVPELIPELRDLGLRLKRIKDEIGLQEDASLNLAHLERELGQAVFRYEAAKRGLGIANKLTDVESKRKNLSRVMSNMNILRSMVLRLEKMVGVKEDLNINVIGESSNRMGDVRINVMHNGMDIEFKKQDVMDLLTANEEITIHGLHIDDGRMAVYPVSNTEDADSEIVNKLRRTLDNNEMVESTVDMKKGRMLVTCPNADRLKQLEDDLYHLDVDYLIKDKVLNQIYVDINQLKVKDAADVLAGCEIGTKDITEGGNFSTTADQVDDLLHEIRLAKEDLRTANMEYQEAVNMEEDTDVVFELRDSMNAARDRLVDLKQRYRLMLDNEVSEFERGINEDAPPGMEDVVKALKKKYPDDTKRAYSIAWSMYNKKK
jgi:hypothetical protein